MKLLKLEVQGYKNLKDIKIDFTETNVTVFVGANGSGKSNILEVISEIFKSLYYDPTPKLDFSCELSYELNGKYIAFVKKPGYVRMTLNTCDIPFEEYKKDHLKYLPSQIISLYSGETNRLWKNSYENMYKEFTNSLIKENCAKLQMVYVNHYHWELALLLLAVYKKEKYDELNLPSIEKITVVFSNKNIESYKLNDAIKLLKELKFSANKSISFTFDELKRILELQGSSLEVFNILSLLSLPKDNKFIEEIQIEFNGFSLIDLSEGEKRMALITTVYEILADGETLLLLDEPETYIHETKKELIFNIAHKYNKNGVCSLVTTHSSTLVSMFNEKEILGLQKGESCISIVKGAELKKLENLFVENFSPIKINELIQSDKCFLLLEGKDDVNYINKAIEIFKKQDSKYDKLDFNILSFNGANNAQYFVSQFSEFVKNNKIICVFDRDDSGVKGLNAVTQSNNSKNFAGQAIKENIVAFLYPPAYGKSIENDFLVEEYFNDDYVKKIVDKFIEDGFQIRYKSKPNLNKQIKDTIIEDFKKGTIKDSSYDGFKVLLDKLLTLI